MLVRNSSNRGDLNELTEVSCDLRPLPWFPCNEDEVEDGDRVSETELAAGLNRFVDFPLTGAVVVVCALFGLVVGRGKKVE